MARSDAERSCCGPAGALIVRAGLVIGGVTLLVIASAVKSDGCYNKDQAAESAGISCSSAKENGLCQIDSVGSYLCPKACGECADDDDGLFAQTTWEAFSTIVWVWSEVFILMFFVLFFFCVPDSVQEMIWTKLALGEGVGAAGNATGHVPLAGDEEEAEQNNNNKTVDKALRSPLIDDVDQQAAEDGQVNARLVVEGDKPSSPKKQRVYFVDNLRSFLTAVVVTHHIVCGLTNTEWSGVNLLACKKKFATYTECFDERNFFSDVIGTWALTINQSYFMALFFFISGLFSPGGLKRKGTRLFIKDKIKRLGIPYLMWQCVLGPLFYTAYIPVFFMDAPPTEYNFVNGPPWFILVLLIFNVFYAFAPGELPTIRLPSVPMLISIVGFSIGAVYVLFPWAGFTFGVPGGMHSIISYVIFFVGGLIAAKNRWVDELMQYPPRTGRFLYGVSFLILLSTFGYAKLAYDYPDQNADEGDATAWTFVEGIWCVVISLTLMHFFAQHCNVTGPWLQRINDAVRRWDGGRRLFGRDGWIGLDTKHSHYSTGIHGVHVALFLHRCVPVGLRVDGLAQESRRVLRGGLL